MKHGEIVLPMRGTPDRFFVATPKYMLLGDEQYTLVTAMNEIVYEKKKWPDEIQEQLARRAQGPK